MALARMPLSQGAGAFADGAGAGKGEFDDRGSAGMLAIATNAWVMDPGVFVPMRLSDGQTPACEPAWWWVLLRAGARQRT